jgi:hypothetical protein
MVIPMMTCHGSFHVLMQVIGDVGLDKSAVARHRHGARARDHVTVVKLTEDSFLKAVMQQAAEQGVEDMELLVRVRLAAQIHFDILVTLITIPPPLTSASASCKP